MNRKIFNYLEIAANVATQKKDRRSFFLGVVGVRKDGRLVSASNGPTVVPSKNAHAEARVSRKLDVGSIVYIARMAMNRKTKKREFALSKPCKSCQRILKSVGVKRVYYTIGPNEYGIMEFK